MESLVRFCTSGRLPVKSFKGRYNSVNWVRLPNSYGSVEEVKLLEPRLRFRTNDKLPVSSLSERSKAESMLRLLNEKGTWPRKPLLERNNTSNLLSIPNLEEIEEE
ncbi:hypothetical protein AT3G25012, partial [Arabidopsis thaliana]